MFHLNVWLKAKDPADSDKIAEALRRMGKMSLEEKGCRRWEAYRSESEPGAFLLVEHWETKDDWEAHRQAEAIQTIYLPEVIPLVDRQPHPSERVF